MNSGSRLLFVNSGMFRGFTDAEKIFFVSKCEMRTRAKAKKQALDDDEYQDPEEPRKPQNQPKTPPPKYEFTEQDIKDIQEAIIQFGLSYKGIHEKLFKNKQPKVTLSRVTDFIKSPEMMNIRETASAGFLVTFALSSSRTQTVESGKKNSVPGFNQTTKTNNS
jgi:hypothetical protein